jgi:hypothetical protein
MKDLLTAYSLKDLQMAYGLWLHLSRHKRVMSELKEVIEGHELNRPKVRTLTKEQLAEEIKNTEWGKKKP